MEVSDLLRFFDSARDADTWVRKTKHQPLIWISGDHRRAMASRPLVALDLRAVGFPECGYRRWAAGVAIRDDALASSRGAASTDILVECDVSICVERDAAPRTRLIQWLLNEDRPPLPAALRKIALDVLTTERDRHNDVSFAVALGDPIHREAANQRLRDALEDKGFKVQWTKVRLPGENQPERLEYQDQSAGLQVRLKGGLNATRVHWLIRLRPATTAEGKAARSAYRGTFEGKAGKAYEGGVPGQYEPVEAWIPHLIADAMARVDMAVFLGADESWRADVLADVSRRLEAGVGYITEELTVRAVGLTVEEPLVFRVLYEITGTPGRAIAIEHRMMHRMVDEAAWKAAGSPKPADEVVRHTRRIVEKILQGKRYAEVLSQLHTKKGADDLQAQLQMELKQPTLHFGHQVSAIVCVLHIPEAEYLAGRTIDIEESEYHLKDAGQTVSLAAAIEVSVDDMERFAEAQTKLIEVQNQEMLQNNSISAEDSDKLEKRIRELVHRALGSALRITDASAYYRSEFTSGEKNARSAEDASARYGEDALEAKLQQGVQNELAVLGLKVERFEMRVHYDAIIIRMNELRSLPVEVDLPVEFEGRPSHVKGGALVSDFSREHWQAFYQNARRHRSVEDHVAHIEHHLTHAIGYLKNRFAEGADAVRGLIESGDLQRVVQDNLERQVGIKVTIAPLYLEVPTEFDDGFERLRINNAREKILEIEMKPPFDEQDIQERETSLRYFNDIIAKAEDAIKKGRRQTTNIPLIETSRAPSLTHSGSPAGGDEA